LKDYGGDIKKYMMNEVGDLNKMMKNGWNMILHGKL
jgi:hypothetical protein